MHKCEHMKACEIRRSASARTTWKLQEYTKQSYEKKYLNYIQFLADDSTIEKLTV